MRWVHDSAAASAKRTEIRRPHRGSRRVEPRLKIPADICNPLMKSEFRPPAALAGPPSFRSRFCRLLLSSYIFYGVSCLGGAQNSNSGRLRAQILETLCELCSLGAQNPKSGHLWTQILDTLCKSCCLGAQNSKSEHFGPILLRILLQAIDQFD